jgi:UDP-glucose 4-epimerase
MRALVTGGAGFIGSHLLEALEANGWYTSVVDNLSTGLASNLPGATRFVAADAGDESLLDEILPGTDTVFHLAAVSSVQDALDRPFEVHEVNLTMTLKVLEAAARHKVRRFVFSSSAAIYGDTEGRPAKESMLPRPLSHYAVQKLACEHYCQAYRRLHGLETVCLRYFNVYGPRQRADSAYSGVISRFIEAALHEIPVTVYGDGSQTRDFIHVSDVVRANLCAATAHTNDVSGKVFNVGTGIPTSISDVAALAQRICPSSPAIRHLNNRLGEIRQSRAHTALAASILGFKAEVVFPEGFVDVVREYKEAFFLRKLSPP